MDEELKALLIGIKEVLDQILETLQEHSGILDSISTDTGNISINTEPAPDE